MTVPIIQSGYFRTPSGNTPTGAPKKIAVNNPYVSKDEFIASFEAGGLGIDSSSPYYATELDKVLLRASAWVNRYCHRYFDTQTIDETETKFYVRLYNPQLVHVPLKNSPYQQINSMYIQVLKYFIQIDTTSANSYIQDFPDYGYVKIVPMLSSAGTGAGTPIPSAILDRLPLGVLWVNYTFGYGTPVTGYPMGTGDGANKIFQTDLPYRLWAPDQTITIYDNGTPVASTAYVLDAPNGKVTFNTAPVLNHVITSDFLTNESLPSDIKEATILLASYMIGQAGQNPTGATSYSLQTFSITFGENNQVYERVKTLLDPYVINTMRII